MLHVDEYEVTAGIAAEFGQLHARQAQEHAYRGSAVVSRVVLRGLPSRISTKDTVAVSQMIVFTSGKWQATRCPGACSWRSGSSVTADFLVLPDRAPGMEAAPGRRVERARHITFQQDAGPLPLDSRVGRGYRRQQCMGVGVHRLGEQPVGACFLDDLPQDT